jgi:pimeloyl-ACP methyl ester carboxylesterase
LRRHHPFAAAYFGRAPHHSYSLGCSTGGREGMMAAQRYPSLFDGVIAGAPAMRTGHTRVSGWNVRVAFNRIAPRDPEGKPLVLHAFPAEDQKLLASAVAKQCDALDGLEDGLIMNLAACRFDPAVLQCREAKNASCLTAGQVDALNIAFGVPRDSEGRAIYAPYPYDLGLLGEHVGNVFGLIPGSVPGPYDTPPSPFDFDFSAELERLRTNGIQILSDTDKWTDLGTFYRRGGKILFVHGASDPWFSVLDTQDYVQRAATANPGFDSSRFYSVPGMGHCAGGGLERFDVLTAMVDWVENGVGPGAIVATGGTGTRSWNGGNRPLCPWPQHAHYKGVGDPRDADSFECRGG